MEEKRPRSFKRTLLGYLYPLAGCNFLIGAISLFCVIPPWHFRPELSYSEQIEAAILFLIIGLSFLWVAWWAFRRGPIDLSKGEQIAAAWLLFIISIAMPFLSSGGLWVSLVISGTMVLWGLIILQRAERSKKSQEP